MAEQKLEPAEQEMKVLRTLRDGLPEIVDTEQGLTDAIVALARSDSPVAIDTERAQGFRFDASAYLVQIRRDDVGTFLIDTHVLTKLAPLSAVLDKTWIFHAATQDLPCLAEIGMAPRDIFDTEIAARLLGFEHFSLRGVCEAVLGVTLEKTHQREDWSLRPLPKDWLRYAAMDVEVLPALHEKLRQALQDAGRWEWAEQEFINLRENVLQPKPSAWQNMKGLGRLRTPSELAVAKELWQVREELGRQADLSPSRVLSTRGIIEAAAINPQVRRRLQSIPEFQRPRARRHGEAWWNAVRFAQSLTATEMPRIERKYANGEVPPFQSWRKLNPDAVPRLQSVREMIAAIADPLKVDPTVILEPRAQRELAWTPIHATPDDSEMILDAATGRLQRANARQWQQDLVSGALAESPRVMTRLTQGN